MTGNGPLVPADETLTHQIVDTFATVGQSDLAWTEKVWATATARDGSLQVVFGIGKYTNRGVFDGAGGVSRGTEQWTVRGSRRLATDPASTSVGPLHYTVVEPLRSVRCVLEPTEHAAIAYDVTWIGRHPASLEIPWPDRSADGARVAHDVLRYHQVGAAHGWVEVEGERTEITPDAWISVRDHSWGTRPEVGPHIKGLAPGRHPHELLMVWFPMVMERADGTPYALFAFYERRAGTGFESVRSQAEEQRADGTAERFASVVPALQFHDGNRRVRGGTLTLVGTDGTTRPLTVTPVSATGFHLGTGGYFGWNGRALGQWAGELVVDGEHLDGLDRPEVAREVHQLRDQLVRIEDPVGGGTGLGHIETMVMGAFPEMGLSADTSFL